MVLEENKTSSKVPAGEFNSSDLKVGGVVVYRDRAEVKRIIRVSVKKGENDVVVNQLPSVVDPKSLRLVLLRVILSLDSGLNITVCLVRGPICRILVTPTCTFQMRYTFPGSLRGLLWYL